MSYNIKLIKKDDLSTEKWSGGTTTQLYIYPENTEYKNKNFKWRVSISNIDEEESYFTYLPGIKRKIMVLDGELYLEHENMYSKKLSKYEQHNFSGSWSTKSRGKIRDFNLMLNNECIGDIDYISIKKGTSRSITLETTDYDYKKVSYFIYIIAGDGKIISELEYKVYEGDFIIFTKLTEDENIDILLENNSIDKIEIILGKVYFD